MRNHVALWSGVYSFFATILAIGAINVFNPEDQLRFIGAIVVGTITAGAVYAKQKLDDEKASRANVGTLVVREVGDKIVYSLELDDDPEGIENRKEVLFKVKKEKSG